MPLAPRDDVTLILNTTSRSRGVSRPSFAGKFRPLDIEGAVRSQEGRREDRVRAAPAVSRAKGRIKRTRAYRFSGSSPAFPAQWFYSLFRALLGDRLFCHHRCAEKIPRNLTPASGRQDHTTSPSALALFVKSASASTASRPTSVTIAKRPSFGTGWP